MRTIQANKLKMYLSVRNFFITVMELAKLIPYFLMKYAPFEKSVSEIQVISEMQKNVITGLAKEKMKLREALIKISADYSRMLSAIAKFSNDSNLMDKVRFTVSDLKRMSDVALKDYAEIIYDKVGENISKLAEYEITPDSQKIYQDLIISYNASLSTPRTGIAEKSQTTRKLAELFKQADAALTELDFAIEAVQTKQPDLYNGYKAVRKIVDSGTGKLALKATATDLLSGKPVKGVIFSFHPEGTEMTITSGNGIIIKKTADKGIFHIKSMQAGTYKVVVNKPGYKEKEVMLNVADGERSDLKVELEKA
jgi:hypothetical protein